MGKAIKKECKYNASNPLHYLKNVYEDTSSKKERILLTEVSGLENEKLLKPEELSRLKLPTELLSYLSESNRYKSRLYESILKDIEELYLYYTSLYSFSSIEFTELALRALDRANNAEKFFFYPKLFEMLQKYIKDCNLESNEHLLYGMRGKPLENKQFNAITRNLCISLGWITVRDSKPGEVAADKNSVIEGRKLYTNTEKYFTPHGFRYSISTIFSEMGVMHDSIKYLLNHSDFEKGNLKSYILSDQKYIKEIQTGQLIIETLFETALNLEQKNNITLDIERIEHDLPNVFEYVKRDENEIHQFQNYIINFAFAQAQQQLANTRMIEKNIPFEQFGYSNRN